MLMLVYMEFGVYLMFYFTSRHCIGPSDLFYHISPLDSYPCLQFAVPQGRQMSWVGHLYTWGFRLVQWEVYVALGLHRLPTSV